MGNEYFTPVTITRAIAQLAPTRRGYTVLVYQLSAVVDGGWIARFDDACRATRRGWTYDWPIAHADRIEVLLPDRDYRDRAALAAIKAQLLTAIGEANRRYGSIPAEVVAAGAREIAWQQAVLKGLQVALDEQFPG